MRTPAADAHRVDIDGALAAPEVVLAQLCDRLLEAGAYQRVTGYLREPQRDAYRPLTTRGRGGAAWRAALKRRPFPSAGADPALAEAIATGPVPGRRLVRHRLVYGGEPIGVLIGETDPFAPPVTAATVQDIQNRVDDSALAVSISLRYRQAGRDRDSLAALGDVVTGINSAVDLRPLLAELVVHARELLGAASARLEFIRAADPGSRELVAVSGEPANAVGRHRPAQEGLGGFLLRSRRPLAVFWRSAGRWSDALDEIAPYVQSLRSSYQSMLGVPLEDPWGAPLGFIAVFHPEPERFDHLDLELLGRLGAQAALAVGKARLLERERARGADLQVLAEVSRTMTDSEDQADLLVRAQAALARLAPGVPARIDVPGPGPAGGPGTARLTLRSGADRLGVLTVTGPPAGLPADQLATLTAFAGQLGAALRIRQLMDTLRASAGVVQREARRFELITSVLHDLVCLLGDRGEIRWASPSLAVACGRPEADLDGQPFPDLLHPEDRGQLRDALERVAAGGPDARASVHVRLAGTTTETVWLETILTRVQEETGAGFLASSRVVTERKRLEDLLIARAYSDSLTGLPNRARLLARLADLLDTPGPGSVAALFVDLDRFKTVNDSLGHDAGDALLVAAAARLSACLRPADLIARLGGDEFVILLENVAGAEQAARAAERVLAAFSQPVPVGDASVAVSVSIGIALAAPGLDSEPADLIRDADVAMYAAKRAGRGRWSLFDPAARSRAVDQFSLEADLRVALAANALTVHYQPIVQLATGVAHGVEALVRWPHPRRGLLLPDAFLALAEETGLVDGIGRQVLALGTAAAARWRADPRLAQLKVALNVSPAELMGGALPDQVDRALAAAGLPASALVLEITETSLWRDEALALRQLLALRERGVTLALDDFGTGFSSLSHLVRLPVQIVKIDRSFTAALLTDPRAASLTRAVIRLGMDLDLDVVAEGVETPGQAAELARLGCRLGQGFWFSRPLPGEQVAAALTARAESVPVPRAPARAVSG